jgi:hypothetical protein
MTSSYGLTCPECGGQMTVLNQKFRPPKKADIKKWKIIEFLKDNGFVFQHVYKDYSKRNGLVTSDNYVDYPTTIEEAQDFIQKYREQAYKVGAKK